MSQNVWATIMPFGPVTLFYLLAQIFFFVPAYGWPSFQTLKLNTIVESVDPNLLTREDNSIQHFI
jgi:hypothetical protein